MKPRRPCADCGGTAFVRSALYEHVGEYGNRRLLGPVALWVLACRQCGLAELRVPSVAGVKANESEGIDFVDLEPEGPYR
jgi:hypothetical protein